MMSDDQAKHDHVVGLVDKISNILAGEDIAIGQTALTLAVAVQMVAMARDRGEMMEQAAGFSKQLNQFVARDDIVEWIKSMVIYAPTTTTRRQ